MQLLLGAGRPETRWRGPTQAAGPKTVEIALWNGGAQTVTSEQVFINTGARPAVPKIEGLHQIKFLDSTSAMELDAVPEHRVILGGSYIALEFEQMFRRFGSEVTVIEQSTRIMRAKTPTLPKKLPRF